MNTNDILYDLLCSKEGTFDINLMLTLTNIIFIKEDQYNIKNIFARNIETGKIKQLTNSVINIPYFFKMNKKYIMGVDTNPDLSLVKCYLINVDTFNISDISDIIHQSDLKKQKMFMWVSHPNHKLKIVTQKWDKTVGILDIENKKYIEKDKIEGDKFFINKNLEIIITRTKIRNGRQIFYKNKKLLEYTNGNIVFIKSLSYDSKKLYTIENIDADQSSFVCHDLEFGTKETLYKFNGFVESFITDDNNEIIAIGINYHKFNWVSFDNKISEIIFSIKQKINEEYFHIVSTTSTHWLVKIMPLNSLSYTVLYDINNYNIKKLELQLNIFNFDFKLLTEREIFIPTRDNLYLPCYITYPNIKPNSNYPTILMLHGGPVNRYRQKFNAESKFFAHNNYCVVRVNTRGSEISVPFVREAFGELGKGMIYDIHDVVDYLIDNNISDPDNIGLYGFSYGSDAVLEALINKPNKYKFGIAFAGLTDIQQQVKRSIKLNMRGSIYSQIYTKDFLDDLYNKKISPKYNYKKIKAKLLLIKGYHDSYGKGEYVELYENMIANNQPVKYLEFADESHIFYKKKNIKKVWKTIKNFIKIY